MTQMDQAKLEAFGAKTLGVLNGAALALMMSVGHRTRLFDVMAGLPPSTSAQIAGTAGLHERYVREWLGAMVTGGIVDHDPDAATYTLPPEHAAFLTRPAGTNNMATYARAVALLANVEDDIVECFTRGGGVPYENYRQFPEVMREMSASTFDTLLVEKILPLAPGVIDALRRGIRTLEVGCGSGRATNRMAQAFPASRFVGYDLLAAQIEAARREAREWGLTNVEFAVRDVARLDPDDSFDLVTAFDAVHDQADPAGLLAHISSALTRDGTFLMWDVAASSDLHENIDHLLGPYFYTVSCMHCMPVSLARNGAGLGAMWGQQTARRMLAEAGFPTVTVQQIEEDPASFCYVARKT